MKISIPIAVLDQGGGRTTNLLLSKDERVLEQWLAQAEAKKLVKKSFLVQSPDPGTVIFRSREGIEETSLGFQCRVCGRSVYHYQNKFHQGVHCGCTILLFPLDRKGMYQSVNAVNEENWARNLRSALNGIKGWLRSS